MLDLKASAIVLLASVQTVLGSPTRSIDNDLLVKTSLFSVQGIAWPNSSEEVRFFGAIPYAEPPTGTGRFWPPITKEPVNETIDGSWFGPSCIQYSTGAKTVYTEYVSGFLLTPGQQQSEDCLTLNVWAPRANTSASATPLPVMIWIHGGGFTSGGSASPYKYGDRLARDQNVIVVAINYRLNIFGFPNAAALDGSHLNPGLEDQRRAVEWTYDNIQSFGGNPDQMILFGHGMSVDKYNYAYWTDPIVKGFIAQSGTADGIALGDPTGSNFTYVASQVGCVSDGKDDEFACMQKANASDIIAVYNTYNATENGGQSLSFSPTPDNYTSFSNNTDRAARGLFAKLPTILSQVNNEGASLVPYDPAGPNQTAVDAFTRSLATCPIARGALARKNYVTPIYRTRYFGTWPNLNPLPWLGAYHSSDIPMIFGTSDLRGPDTEVEAKLSKYYQSAWAAFARDPEHGLETFGWPLYDPNGETLIKLGVGNATQAVLGQGDEFDEGC
ncbi:alpha/beta-hydrolase [Lophiostoma macrostomum CBS 122681]|uniref:Alpha/beta-hydrolase n=1 Tax=Lophiostoma macrostomum CBS 122681 TaxID=1314788 RepID=A0A6A6STK4_9PLEO|nr:alpha/beta-hydrolase [Lophiostoma macrostomum CBS 122681]